MENKAKYVNGKGERVTIINSKNENNLVEVEINGERKFITQEEFKTYSMVESINS